MTYPDCIPSETWLERTTATVPDVAAALASPAFGFTVELVAEHVAFLRDAQYRTVRLWDNGGEMGAAVVNDLALPVFAPTRLTGADAADYGTPLVVAYRLFAQLNGADSHTLWEETADSLADALCDGPTASPLTPETV
jgi:hypothetical protein